MKDFGYDVMDAVNHGDDTDTVGAVTGGLAGIIYGLGYDEKDGWKNYETKSRYLTVYGSEL